eukprot:299805-Rhodomonas_salina.1
MFERMSRLCRAPLVSDAFLRLFLSRCTAPALSDPRVSLTRFSSCQLLTQIRVALRCQKGDNLELTATVLVCLAAICVASGLRLLFERLMPPILNRCGPSPAVSALAFLLFRAALSLLSLSLPSSSEPLLLALPRLFC